MTEQTINETTPAQATPAPPERPAWLPERFKTPEDLANSYKKLESLMGNRAKDLLEKALRVELVENEQKQKAAPSSPEGEQTADTATPTEPQNHPDTAAANQAVKAAGLDMASLEAEFMRGGDISAKSYEALAAVGIGREVVSRYLAGVNALAEREMSDLHAIAGGADQFESMWEWSTRNLPKVDREAVNEAIATNNPKLIKQAFQVVHTRYVEAEGKAPKVQLRGGTGGGTSDGVYESMADVQADMKKPEYKTSQKFRDTVAAKLKRSSVF